MMSPPYLNSEFLDGLSLSTREVVESIENLLRGIKEGRVWNAPKSVILPPDDRFMMSTLTCSDDPPFMSVKALLLNPHNPKQGLEAIQSVVTLLNSQTGVPAAIIDGNWITAIRTAGLSAVAAKRLANPNSSVVAFIGCGVQARSHLRAFADIFPIREARMFGRGTANRQTLRKLAEEMGLAVSDCISAQDAVLGADLIVSSVTLSPRPEPFVDARWLKPGAFAAIADLAIPWAPEGMSNFETIVIDDLTQERQMEKPMVDLSLVTGDLASLFEANHPDRHNEKKCTAFVFRGFGIGDLAVAALAFQRWQLHH